MPLYIIQDRATGKRLPLGGSKAEFSDSKAPRLFTRRCDATNTLECWREGHWFVPVYGYYVQSLPGPLDSPRNNELAAKRQAMNIRVRQVRLTVVPEV